MSPRRAALAALTAIAAVAVITHLPPVSRWLVRSLIDRVEGPLGLDIETGDVRAWPVGLSATLRDVRIRDVNDAEPFLTADALTIDLPFAAIRNRSRIGDITLARPRIDIDGLIRWLDSRPPSRTPTPNVPRIDRVVVTDATLQSARDGLAFTFPALALAMRSTVATPLAGDLTSAGATLRLGDVVFRDLALDGALRYDGAIGIERARLASHDTVLDLSGRIGMREGDRAMALTVSGTIAPLRMLLAPYLTAPALDGAVTIDGRVGGTFVAPELIATLTSPDVTIDGARSGPLSTQITLTRQHLIVGDTAWDGLFGGRATGRARFAFNDARDATIDVTVRGVATLPVITIVDPTWPMFRGRATGTLSIHGPLATRLRPQVTSDMVLVKADASPLATSGRVSVTLDPKRWAATLRGVTIGDVAVDGEMGGVRPTDPAAPFADSSIAGAITASATSAAHAIDLAHAFDVFDLDLAPYEFGGALTAEATLRGTVRLPVGDAIVEVPTLTAHGGLTGDLHAEAAVGRFSVDLHEGRATLGDTSATLRGRIDARARTIALDQAINARSNDTTVRLFDLPRHLVPSGAFTAVGRWTGSPQLPRLDMQVTSDAWTVAGQAPMRATGTVGWDGDIVTCTPCAFTRDGSTVDLTGRIDLVTERIEARGIVEQWAVTPISWPQGTAGITASTTYPVAGLLSGRFDVTGLVDDLTGSINARMDDTQWDAMRPGTITADVTLADRRAMVTLGAPALAAAGRITASQRAPHAFDASADVIDVELAALVERLAFDARGTTGRVTGTLTASGQLDDPDSVRGRAALQAFEGTWRDLPLRLERPATIDWTSRDVTMRDVAASLDDVGLAIDGELTSSGEARGLHASLSGRAERIAAILTALDMSAPAVKGGVEATLAVTGPAESPRIDGQVTIADGELQWTGQPAISGINAGAKIADGVITLTSFAAVAQDASVTATGRAPLRMFADALPPVVARRLPRSTVGTASLDATLTNLTHATALAFVGERVPNVWRGGVDAKAALVAERAALDAVDGTLTVTRATLATGDLAVAQAAPGVARIDNGTVTLAPWRFEGGGTDLTAAGAVRLADASRPYSLSLDGTLDLRLLGTFLPGRVNGTLQSKATVQGSATGFDVFGRLDIVNANWIARDLGLAITGLSGPLVLGRDRITVDGVSARVNGGSVTATGSLSTGRDGRATSEIVFKGSGIALDTAGVVSEVSGEIRASSPGRDGLPYGLSGDIFVQPGIVRSSLRQIAMSATGSSTTAPTTTSMSGLLDQIGLDLRVRTIDDLVADSNELKLSIAGDVTLTGTLAAPGARGALTVTDEGELFFGGRLYRVTSGRIEFSDPAAIEPRLNVVADTRVAGYDVTMQLLGTPADLTTRLTSDPPLSEGDLASLLATGRTLDERSGVTGDEAKAQLISAVSSEYLGVVGRWFGLDTVRIEQNNTDLSATDLDPVARLNVTKTFGRSLDVLYSQSLSKSDDNAWVVTYRTGWKRLDVRATVKTRQGGTLEVRQELTFGGGATPPPRRRRVDTRPRVVDVTFSGLDANDERDSRQQMRLRAGKRFDVFEWRRDQERIAAMFRKRDRQRVTVSSYRRDVGRPGEVAIDYVVDPGPVTTLDVSGATLSARALGDMREAWSQIGVDEFLEEEWREIAVEDLVTQGYVEPTITSTISTPDNPWIRRDGRVAIEPGRKVASREVTFEGNALIPDEQLRKLIVTARLDPAAWVRPSLLSAPIRELYAALGHLEAQVATDPVRVDGERALLPVRITEGRQFLVGTLSIAGETALTEAAISSALGLEAGAVYLPGVAQRGADRVAELYRNEAYPGAMVSLNASVDPATASATIHVTISEGTRQVLADMVVTGDTITSPGLFSRAAGLRLQSPLAGRHIDEAQSRLYDTGIFRSVTPTVEPLGAPLADGTQPVRLTFAVEDQPRYRLRYGLQASTSALSDNGFSTSDVQPGVSVDARRTNLFGRGFFAGVGGSATTDSNRVRFLTGSSTWFGREADTTLSLERRYATAADALSRVDLTSVIASAEQRWPITRNTKISAGYAFESTTLGLTIKEILPGLSLDDSLTSELGSVSSTYTWDTRDNVFNATRGLFHSSRVEYGDRVLGSDLRYLKVLVQQYGFVKRVGVVFASAVRYGTISMGDDTDIVSPSVRFRAGGATTVRGYAQDALSQGQVQRTDLPTGGNALLILNQEVRVPIWGWLGGVAFVDAGNTFRRPSDLAIGDLMVGLGGGMRLNTPFGIIRLDVARPVREPSATRRTRWYFGFGHAF